MSESGDPDVVHTVVVTATDLVTALETGHRNETRDVVLRMTAPFSGRMRARIHVRRGSASGDPAPICLEPEALVTDTCPAPPEPDDVEDALRADPSTTYSLDRHKERYRTALERWRAAVPDHVVDTVRLPATDREVTISILGTVSEE